MHCAICDEFNHTVRLQFPYELEHVLKFVRPAIEQGRLKITNGSLEWADIISCDLSCTACGRHFHLGVDTYHGSGGKWRPDHA